MQNQHKYRCDRNVQRHVLRVPRDLHDLNDLRDSHDLHGLTALEFRISSHMAEDFITVHTFGGRGSPSF